MAKTILACMCYLVFLVSLTPANAQNANPVEMYSAALQPAGAISDIAEFIRTRLNAARAANPIAGMAKAGAPDPATPSPNPSFVLNSLTFDRSHYLDQTILDQFNKQLAGRPINLPVLSAVPAIINDIYAATGILTGSAILKPQTSANGIIHVSLIEPIVGEVRVSGEGRTNPAYILNGVDIAVGAYPDFGALAKNLFVFSTLNNMKLTARFEPSSSPDLVDIVLVAEARKEAITTVSIDNYGAFETGQNRVSAAFQHLNVTGYRDIFNMSTIAAEGFGSLSANYSFAIGSNGTRIAAGATYSASKVVYGPTVSTDLQSQSTSGYLSIQHPLVVQPDMIGWVGMSGNYEHTKSQISGVELTDSVIKEATIFTNWLWREPTYTAAFNVQFGLGNALSNTPTSTDGDFQYVQSGFDLVGALSETFGYKFELDAKYAISQNNPSSVLNSVGGYSTVRGYPEALLSGDSGLNMTLEANLVEPFEFQTSSNGAGQAGTINPFVFVDVGIAVPYRTSGRAITTDDIIASTGLGFNATLGDNISGNVTLAIPVRDTVGFDAKARGPKISFNVVGQF